jgi:uncharacterized metal-binding protein YceD (DUF177 family)
MTPEMSRPIPVDRVGEGLRYVVNSTEAERQAVAVRMGLVALPEFTCVFELRRADRNCVMAAGELRARAVQTCVISLETFEEEIVEDFLVRFVPDGKQTEDVDLEAEDEIPYVGTTLDLGEAATEQLALALDPFPRKPGASLPSEEEQNAPKGPFAALHRLKNDE